MTLSASQEMGSQKVIMQDTRAMVEMPGMMKDMEIGDMVKLVGPGMSTGPAILPTGIKSVLSQGKITLWVWEQPPRIHQLSWIKAGSPEPYGPGTEYRKVRIALPYLVIVSVFGRDQAGMPSILCKDECFFRNAPLKSLKDELCYPALLNCSKFPGGRENGNPLSWICTQHLKRTKQMSSKDPGDRFNGCFEAVRYCLLETSFNLSSEHHEGNSWYGASKHIDRRIATIEAWEEATIKDPLFVLDVPWIKTEHTLQQLADRIFHQQGAADLTFRTADDIARVILNH